MMTLGGATLTAVMIIGHEAMHIRPIGPLPVMTFDLYFILIFRVIMEIMPLVMPSRGGLMGPIPTSIWSEGPMVFIGINRAMR